MARIERTPAAQEAFGALLRQYREMAGLQQERLAERAGLSAAAISNLERGVNQPRLETVTLLADALELHPDERAALLRAARPERKADVPAHVPPKANGTHHNLPVSPTALLGREQEVAEVQLRLREPDVRVLTLVGAGGVGKTRLALAAGSALLPTYPQGVWMVELAPIVDPALVPGAVAEVLTVRDDSDGPLTSVLVHSLADKTLLLLLDNCEHVLGACAELVSTLLRACPGVIILATSREGLGVSGEHLHRVPSLAVPATLYDLPLEQIARSPAVQLFMARAQAQRPELALTEQAAPYVVEICRRLDGIPLAIELAAARSRSLPLGAIAERLDERFRLLTTGPRDAPQRHQTLRATMEWSWDLLSEREQASLARLSVFVGGWTVDAVEVADDAPRWETLDLLDGLINKSLVEMDETGAEPRYRVLETVRQYGLERLGAIGEVEAKSRHLAWCLELAQRAAPALTGRDQRAWAARLDTEHDNLRAALTWTVLEGHDPASGLLLASLLWRFWAMGGHLGEGRRWLSQALDAAPAASPSIRVTALLGASYLAYRHGAYPQAEQFAAHSLTLARELEDGAAIARALNGAGLVAWSLGDYRRATSLLEESLMLKRAEGDVLGVAVAFLNLGNVAKSEGDYGRAKAMYEEALALQRQLDDDFTLAMTVSNLGIVAELLGEYDRAADLYRESLALRRGLGDDTGIAQSLGNLGMVVFLQGDVKRGQALLEETLTLFRALGDLQGITAALGDLGFMASERGDHGNAVRLQTECLLMARQLGNKESIAGALLSLGTARHRAGTDPDAFPVLREGLALAKEIGDKGLVAQGLESAAHIHASTGAALRALSSFGAAETLRETLGTFLRGSERAEHDRLLSAVHETLDEGTFHAAWRRGKALSLDDAVTLALQDEDVADPAVRQ